MNLNCKIIRFNHRGKGFSYFCCEEYFSRKLSFGLIIFLITYFFGKISLLQYIVYRGFKIIYLYTHICILRFYSAFKQFLFSSLFHFFLFSLEITYPRFYLSYAYLASSLIVFFLIFVLSVNNSPNV
jgi:hypothetical protein